MAFKDLSRSEIDLLMTEERVVRIGFDAAGEHYLVPLCWMQDELAKQQKRGETVVVRIRPSRIDGRKSGPA
jgi:hypothetical protein